MLLWVSLITSDFVTSEISLYLHKKYASSETLTKWIEFKEGSVHGMKRFRMNYFDILTDAREYAQKLQGLKLIALECKF